VRRTNSRYERAGSERRAGRRPSDLGFRAISGWMIGPFSIALDRQDTRPARAYEQIIMAAEFASSASGIDLT
jgi:hypothetical protein